MKKYFIFYMLLVTTILYSQTKKAPSLVQQQKTAFHPQDVKEFDKRFKSCEKDCWQNWYEAIATAIGYSPLDEKKSAILMQFTIPYHNAFFKQDVYDSESAKLYFARVKTIPQSVATLWQEALAAVGVTASGDYPQIGFLGNFFLNLDNRFRDLTNVYVTLVEVDRLFSKEQLNEDESQVLLSRFPELSVEIVKRWAMNIFPEPSLQEACQAAISLSTLDTLFPNGHFSKEKFEKICNK